MDIGGPHPSTLYQGESLWVAYRTNRGDHFAVIRFSGVTTWTLGYPNDEALDTHQRWNQGLKTYSFHEVREPELLSRGLRRWIATFPDDTLDVIGRDAAVLVRAVQARDAQSALSMVEA